MADKRRLRWQEGIVKIFECTTVQGLEYWAIEYHCPETMPNDPDAGKRVRRRIKKREVDADGIRKIARDLTQSAYEGKGYLKRHRSIKLPTVEEGIDDVLKLTNTTAATESLRLYWGEKFCAWLVENHPEVITWADMTASIAQEYAVDLERRGLAFDTVRLALQPIKMAWKHAADNYPEVRSMPTIRQNGRKKEGVIQSLDSSELAGVLDILKTDHADIAGIVTLQSLAGLRVSEAIHLRRQDIDLDAGRIKILSTENHRIKTQESYREIPVCSEIVEALRRRIASQKVVPVGGEIFTNMKGNLWNKDSLGWRWNRTRRVIGTALQNDRVKRFQFHRFRACFSTMASMRFGIPDRLIKSYIGQSPGDTLGSHYIEIRIDDFRPIKKAFDGWRNKIEECQTPGKLLNIDGSEPEG